MLDGVYRRTEGEPIFKEARAPASDEQLAQVQATQKDAEADGLIRWACARQPDAGYLLVQRSMQSEYALQAIKAQCVQLQADLDKARAGTHSSFMNDVNAWGRPTPAPAAPMAPPTNTAPASRAPASASSATPAASAWGSGILGNIATTATGVVAGSFLFQGMQNLMGQHNQGGNDVARSDVHPAPPAPENTAAINYYENSNPTDAVDVADSGSDFGGDYSV